MRQADEITDNESWPVGGSRLRPSSASDEAWSPIGNVASAPQHRTAEPHGEVDHDWEKLLAAALGVSASAPAVFPGSNVDGPDGDTTDDSFDTSAALPAQPADPALIDGVSDETTDRAVAGDADAPEPARLPGWTGDDILPYSRNRRNRWRLFRR